MYYVYCLQNKINKKKLYYGYSKDLKRRTIEHGKYWNLVYYEGYKSEKDAIKREKKLKDYGQARSRLKLRIKDSLNN